MTTPQTYVKDLSIVLTPTDRGFTCTGGSVCERKAVWAVSADEVWAGDASCNKPKHLARVIAVVKGNR